VCWTVRVDDETGEPIGVGVDEALPYLDGSQIDEVNLRSRTTHVVRAAGDHRRVAWPGPDD
jgi:hypothetical protein